MVDSFGSHHDLGRLAEVAWIVHCRQWLRLEMAAEIFELLVLLVNFAPCSNIYDESDDDGEPGLRSGRDNRIPRGEICTYQTGP